MSRLESAIRRLQAQLLCLNRAVELIAGLPGPVLELGLGNGRTYDHLRGLLPEREIFVFDRRLAAHPDCLPDAAHALVGDFRETVPEAIARTGGPAVLANCDTGSGDTEATRELADWLADPLDGLLAPGAVIVSDQALHNDQWMAHDPPDGVAEGRYFMYRKRNADEPE